MTVFVDASALVAMMSGEPEANTLEAMLHTFQVRLTSGLALWETTLAVARRSGSSMEDALTEVQRVCHMLNLTIVQIGIEEAEGAARAHARYGKGNHPARLNMGDCFAYACAKTRGATLLYKGGNFAQTDFA